MACLLTAGLPLLVTCSSSSAATVQSPPFQDASWPSLLGAVHFVVPLFEIANFSDSLFRAHPSPFVHIFVYKY